MAVLQHFAGSLFELLREFFVSSGETLGIPGVARDSRLDYDSEIYNGNVSSWLCKGCGWVCSLRSSEMWRSSTIKSPYVSVPSGRCTNRSPDMLLVEIEDDA